MIFKDFKDCDIRSQEILVVFKNSRYSYAMDRLSPSEKSRLLDKNDPMTKDLILAHQMNLSAIEQVASILDDLSVCYRMVCRADLKESDTAGKWVLCVGGDGTLLDTSHYCDDSPILGINSDPNTSIGALCAANVTNLREVLLEIYRGDLLPTRLSRLSITIDDQTLPFRALNDVLFCNKNPAAMSRFIVSQNKNEEAYRSSGLWIATPAGSTGGIYSAGADVLPIEQDFAIFRQREPYWSDSGRPHFLHGTIGNSDNLIIRSNMTDAAIFIDGPHKSIDIHLGQSVTIGLAEQPLWLFDGPRLNENRKRIIAARKSIRELL